MTTAETDASARLCGAVHLSGYRKGYPDIESLEPIKVSRQRGVYRAVSKKYGPCVIKITSSTPTQLEVDLLRNEFHKLRMCDGNHSIATAYDIYDNQSSLGVAILIEDSGPSLRSWAEAKNDPELQEVLNIGIQIAEGLDHLHRHARLIHSDINPTNVCYDKKQNRACIIDLGSAHGFNEPFKTFTPMYQSPEQARGLTDHRSDLYSLGVLLFQLYTGHLPIQASSHKEYCVAHMLDPPRLISDFRPCHPMFEKLIARLLVKTPDDGYMTAAGLKSDLAQLLALTESDTDGTERFELGTREVPFILMIPKELIGRSKEFSILDDLYDTCLDPRQSGFCYLEGKPGVGKTALVQAFATKRRNPFFFSYKFNQFGDVPIRAIVQIMSGLINQIVASEQFSNEQLRQKFFSSLLKCDVLGALVDIVPAFAKLIPTTKPIPKGLAGDVRKSLYPAIAHVLAESRNICGAPIVAFFDDVQWIDSGTKGVLSYLLAENVPILTIVAFRDKTSQSTFTLDSLYHADVANASKNKPVALSLSELSEENVRELINALALSEADKNALSHTMFKQTEGNPFFLRFRLSMMAETGALVYDVDARLWKLVEDRVDLSAAVTAEDAVEYCVTALGGLDQEVSCVLCRLAMMPQGRTINEYTSILENEKGVARQAEAKSITVAELVHNAVTVAVQKSVLCHRGMGFCFAHDRLQQGATQFASEDEAAEIHYYLGKQVLPTGQYTAEQACEVLDHFSKSRKFITDPDLILRIGTLMKDIVSFYVTAGSHEQLDGWLQFVQELLQRLEESKRKSAEFSALEVRLLIAHHQIKFLMNDLDAAKSLFDSLRPRLQTPAEVRDAYHTRISLLINAASYHEATEATIEALARLDEHSLPRDLVLPEGQPAAIVGEVTQQIKDKFAENPDWDVLQVANSVPLSSDEDHNIRLEMMVSLIPSMYLLGRYDLYIYVPAVACRSILKNGVTRSSGHAFSVLGFALVAVFGDSFGAEVAMIGKHLVDRFDNHVSSCLAYSLSGIAILYDKRYEHMAPRFLYTSYVSGRTGHDILWGCYAAYLMAATLVFEGVPLPEVFDTLEDMYAYAMSDGHQDLAQRALRSTRHTASMLMHGHSAEEPVFHFSIPADDITKSQPLIGLSHGSTAIVALFFQGKLEIAWQLVSEILDNDVDKSGPGLPVFYTFHFYVVVVAHALLSNGATPAPGTQELNRVSEEEREKLLEVMKSSGDILENLNGMAPVFTPYNRLSKACAVDVIERRPMDALPMFESVVTYVQKEKAGKHHDVVAIAQLISADICRRTNLNSIESVYTAKAVETLKKWGARSVTERLSRDRKIKSISPQHIRNSVAHQSRADTTKQVTSDSAYHESTSSIRVRSNDGSGSQEPIMGPDFSSILNNASYITSFSCFDELTEKLSSTLLKEATATRLLLLMRDLKTGNLEPTAEATLRGPSASDTLRNAQYSARIIKITDELQEQVVVHSAQQESPYCFDPYVQKSEVSSIASLPIIYQNSLVAVVYIEHKFRQGVFKPQTMETLALLGQHVASAIVNARLLRDVRRRTAQLEQSHTFLAKALRVKDTILSRTSHELRSPLNGIIGLNEFYVDGSFDVDPEVQNCMKTTLAMARQLLSLVSDILDISCIDEGRFRLNCEATSLHSLVNDVFTVAKFTSSNVRLVNDISESFPKILVDPVRFKQVIFNLVSNGIKFTPEGSVTISCEFLDNKRLIVMTVRDTGIGIDQEHLDVIFEPFGQVESYETQQHQGAGLGLSITKQLIEQHGGRIDVLSTVGEGSAFQVFVPTSPPGLSSQEGGETMTPRTATDGFSPPSLTYDSSSNDIGAHNKVKETLSGDLQSSSSQQSSSSPEDGQVVNSEKPKVVRSDNAVNGDAIDSEQRGKSDQRMNETVEVTKKPDAQQQVSGDIASRKEDNTQGIGSPQQHMIDLVNEGSGNGSWVHPRGTRPLDQHAGGSLKPAKRPKLRHDGAENDASGSTVDPNTTMATEDQQTNIEPAMETDMQVREDSIEKEALRVLAVDDTPVNLKVLTNILRKAGMEVTTATNGELLLKKIAGDQWKQFDVVLLDWMMPVMDGITACRLLRQRIPSDLLPVIFLTAKTAPADVTKAFDAGGTDFAVKPFNRHEVVARTLSQGRASRRARACFFESIPIATPILTKEPFWKMQSATNQKPMFVICLHSIREGDSCTLHGSLLLKFFRMESTTFHSHWSFCEVGQHSVTFLADRTTTDEITAFLRLIIAGWAESQAVVQSESSSEMEQVLASSKKPMVTIGVDYRDIRTHLFAEKQPMLAAMESCTSLAKTLASKGTRHEEIVFSESALAKLV